MVDKNEEYQISAQSAHRWRYSAKNKISDIFGRSSLKIDRRLKKMTSLWSLGQPGKKCITTDFLSDARFFRKIDLYPTYFNELVLGFLSDRNQTTAEIFGLSWINNYQKKIEISIFARNGSQLALS